MRGAAIGASFVGTAGLVLALSGCTSSQEDEATRAADDFVAAVTDGDAESACALLAPATVEELENSSGDSCAATVLDAAAVPGRRLHVDIFGTMSQVRYADDVLFLSRFTDGWRVVAAGCVARPGDPYSCEIEGR